MKTSTASFSPGVEVGALVKRNRVPRVPVAKDVAASATVVPSNDVVEVVLARRVIADGGLGIGLMQ